MFHHATSLRLGAMDLQGGQWVDVIDHWSIIAILVDILGFVVDITLKRSIFHQNIPERRAVMSFVLLQLFSSVPIKRTTNSMF